MSRMKPEDYDSPRTYFWARVLTIVQRLIVTAGISCGLWGLIDSSIKPLQELNALGFWGVPYVLVGVFFAGVALGGLLFYRRGYDRAERKWAIRAIKDTTACLQRTANDQVR